jgi:HMG-box domain
MARMLHRRSRLGRVAAGGRRALPVVLAAWERWQALPEEDKERYRRRAREYAERARKTVADAQRRRKPLGAVRPRRPSRFR